VDIIFPREAAGATGARLSLRPLFLGVFIHQLGRVAPRERGGVSCVIARSERDEAIYSSLARRDGLLRGACHRARVRATRWLAMTTGLFEIESEICAKAVIAARRIAI
jgi:hypothetical protein